MPTEFHIDIAAIQQRYGYAAGGSRPDVARLPERYLFVECAAACGQQEIAFLNDYIAHGGVVLDKGKGADVGTKWIFQQHGEGAGTVITRTVRPENKNILIVHRERIRESRRVRHGAAGQGFGVLLQGQQQVTRLELEAGAAELDVPCDIMDGIGIGARCELSRYRRPC